MKTLIGTLTAIPLLASTALAQDLPKTEINVVGNLGTTTQSRQLETPFWTEQVEKDSDGAITARFRPMNELGLKGSEMFGLLGKGVMNIATGQLGHHSGQDPINDGNDLAGMSANYDEFEKVSKAFFPILSDYYKEKLGLHLLTLQSYQSQVLYCAKEFKGLTDLKGKRVRTSGASQSDFVAYLGGSPIDMPFGEVQQALQQGVIDCAITSTVGGYTSRWYEGSNYIYDLPVNFGAGATVANGAWWDKLDPAVQSFLTKELDELSAKMWEQNRREDREGIACNTDGPCSIGEPAGQTLVEASDADLKLRRQAFLEGVLPGWLKRCGETCKNAWDNGLAEAAGMSAKAD
ncbi:TRAP transporter substrate-binding protein [Jiella mangrovi]|uniref:TRAP transporter substrate-binding protein n=1 Tax=Jiella mangrovi TaxID=2821407 RepID=A0ABS4BL07_9HYPH|nr:TRAP transporter substrate-binding protein [Jiella mangrovi]MBP0617417.1 TRAP transporter substrate-binding protein [Jiella mangrovi]